MMLVFPCDAFVVESVPLLKSGITKATCVVGGQRGAVPEVDWHGAEDHGDLRVFRGFDNTVQVGSKMVVDSLQPGVVSGYAVLFEGFHTQPFRPGGLFSDLLHGITEDLSGAGGLGCQ